MEKKRAPCGQVPPRPKKRRIALVDLLPRDLLYTVIPLAFDSIAVALCATSRVALRRALVKKFLAMLRWQTLCRALRAVIQDTVRIPIDVCTQFRYGYTEEHKTYCRPFCSVVCAEFFLPRLYGSELNMIQLMYTFFAQLFGKRGKKWIEEPVAGNVPPLDDRLVSLFAQHLSWSAFCLLLEMDTRLFTLEHHCGAIFHDGFLAAMIAHHCTVENMNAEKEDFLRKCLIYQVAFECIPKTAHIIRTLVQFDQEEAEWHEQNGTFVLDNYWWT